jgi:hypothetical protein
MHIVSLETPLGAPRSYSLQFEAQNNLPNENFVAMRSLSITDHDRQLLRLTAEEALEWSYIAGIFGKAAVLPSVEDRPQIQDEQVENEQPTRLEASGAALASLGSALIHFIITEDDFLRNHITKNAFNEAESANRRFQSATAEKMLAELDDIMPIPCLFNPRAYRELFGFSNAHVDRDWTD